MLFVVVLEFFICWTPLYVINTIALFNPQLVYNRLGYTSISICQLLAYSSSKYISVSYSFVSYEDYNIRSTDSKESHIQGKKINLNSNVLMNELFKNSDNYKNSTLLNNEIS